MSYDLHLQYQAPSEGIVKPFTLPLSKSIEARRLMLQAVQGLPISTPKTQDREQAEDLDALAQALRCSQLAKPRIDVLESGTAMRFMLAYLAIKAQVPTLLLGQARQHQRPIAPLVEALRSLGANINYQEHTAYPPLLITPSRLSAKSISLDASSSSQYLSALLLIAPLLGKGIYQINTRPYGTIASQSYAEMTIKLMRQSAYLWQNDNGLFTYQGYNQSSVTPPKSEADWSAASYAYLLLSLEAGCKQGGFKELFIPQLYTDSLQGDAQMLCTAYQNLGIFSHCHQSGLSLILKNVQHLSPLHLDCRANPDIVPTLIASCVGNGRAFCFTGVGHLRIKESDRLSVLARELSKVGVNLRCTQESVSWCGDSLPYYDSPDPLILCPEQDHRMAMALAPLMARFIKQGVIIQSAHCVGKSFPSYWREIRHFGYKSTQI